MGRTQTFDTAEAVRAARGVFWKYGYEAASVPELEAATGLRRSSIYHAFGSKRGLFDAAVESYLDEIVRPRLAPLTKTPVPAPDAILDYLWDLREAVERSGSVIAASGCLLINAAGAAIADDAAVREIIADYRTELAEAIGNGIRAHCPDLEDPQRLTDTVTALVVAAYALARVDTPSAVHSLDAAMDLIERA
jgi:AcrR family transcriptional regulator